MKFSDLDKNEQDYILDFLRGAVGDDGSWTDDDVYGRMSQDVVDKYAKWYDGEYGDDDFDEMDLGFDPDDYKDMTIDELVNLLSSGDIDDTDLQNLLYGYMTSHYGRSHNPDFIDALTTLYQKGGSDSDVEDLVYSSYSGPISEKAVSDSGSGLNAFLSDAKRIAGIRRGIQRAVANDTDDVTILDTDKNGEDDTAVVTGDTPDEIRDNVKKAKKKLSDDEYDAENIGDDEEDECDGIGLSDKKMKNKKDCVSDETQKNIISALMEQRF